MCDAEFEIEMERARMDAWRIISPLSNLHDSACGDNWPCYNPEHYPDGDPLDRDEDDRTQRWHDFMNGRLR